MSDKLNSIGQWCRRAMLSTVHAIAAENIAPMSLRARAEGLSRSLTAKWEFRWVDIKWRRLHPHEDTFFWRHFLARKNTLEIWTHDAHQTYSVFERRPYSYDSRPSSGLRYICKDVGALEASCCVIEWFKNNPSR